MSEESIKSEVQTIAAEFDDSPPSMRRRELVDAEMDITPMIDCVFLLLIFFIVCSTMDSQSAIELAQARHGKGVGERDCVVITVAAGGVESAPVYLADGAGGEPLPADDSKAQEMIVAYIEKARQDDGKTEVLVKADRNVAHRDVARVIRAASKVGGMGLHLAVIEAE